MEAPGDVKRDTTEYHGYVISVVTERMQDGQWAVVARAVHQTPTANEVFPVSVPDRRFPAEQDAHDFGVKVARDWIDENAPPRL
jgi:hypothetical protein